MHSQLAAVFAEHANPTHTSKRTAHDLLAPILRAAADGQKQVLEYRALIAAAELAEHDPALDGKLEMMHQTLAAMEREAAALSLHGRQYAQTHSQLDRYMELWNGEIVAWEASQAAPALVVAETPSP